MPGYVSILLTRRIPRLASYGEAHETQAVGFDEVIVTAEHIELRKMNLPLVDESTKTLVQLVHTAVFDLEPLLK